MYEQSHRDYLHSGYLHHRLPNETLIVTVITPLPTKQRDKNARELKLANAAITECRYAYQSFALITSCRSWLMLAESDALRDDVPSFVVGASKLICRSVREATTASGVDNAASPTGRHR